MYDINEMDEYPPKKCEICDRPAIEDMVCRECGWTICTDCRDKEEWVKVARYEDDLCIECYNKGGHNG